MRVAHLSDLHLGFRAFPRAERGRNLRERDVGEAFRRAMQEVARLRPEAVLLTGDLFDRPDPHPSAYLALQRGLGQLRQQLPAAPILAIAGARDTPLHPAESGPVAWLDGLPGVEAAAGAPRSVRVRSLGLHALLVPHRALASPPWPELRPDPEARWNLLLLRGLPVGAVGEDHTPPPVPLDPRGWSYIAVGGPHAPGGSVGAEGWAGALERPEHDPWAAGLEERGFLTIDLESGSREFHPLPGRPIVDLASVRVERETPADGARRLRDLLEGTPGGVEGKLVRIRLRGDILDPRQGIGDGLLSALLSRTAHVAFDLAGPGPGPAPRTRGGAPPLPVPHPSIALRAPGGEWEALGQAGPTPVLLTASSGAERRAVASALVRGPEGGDDETGIALRLQLPLAPHPVTERILGERGSPEQLVARALDAARTAGARSPAEGADREAVGLEEDRGAPEGSRSSGEPGVDPLDQQARALAELRADAVEAAGDLEFRALEWARERQEADSRLLACRDRARELRERLRRVGEEGGEAICPTCQRPLGDASEGVRIRLGEEWDAVVQDGRWWKRRREQLEEKPEGLRRLEEEVLRRHAAVEAESEALERARERRRVERAASTHDPVPVSGDGSGREGDASGPRHLVLLDEEDPELRPVLREAVNVAAALSGGRVCTIRVRDGRLVLGGPSGIRWTPEGEDLVLLGVALRVALTRLLTAPLDPLVLAETAESGSEGILVPFLELAPALLPDRPVLVVAPPGILERSRGAFRAAWHFERDQAGRWSHRELPAGEPRLRFD